MDGETEKSIIELLWAYRHIWYAEEFPEETFEYSHMDGDTETTIKSLSMK